MKRRSTTAALLVGLALGCVAMRVIDGAAGSGDAAKDAIEVLRRAQESGFATFQQSLAGAAKGVIAAIDEELKPMLAAGNYKLAEVMRNGRGPLGSKSSCESIAAARLGWFCLPGLYDASGEDWKGHQLLLARDGSFTITPWLESGSSGTWEWTDGQLVLKSDRGWTRRLDLAPHFATKDVALQWREALGE